MTNLPFTGTFKVTCEYRRKGNWAAGFHTGIDLVGNWDIYSVCDGIVIMAANSYGAYGKTVKIKDSETGNIFLFAHLSKINVKKNQRVTRLSKIGVMGSTGNSTGAHLHIEERTPNDLYGSVLDIAKYMGIPNKVGTYNSNDYEINKNNYKVGDRVLIDVAVNWTGSEENDRLQVDSNGYQFWVHKSVVINYSRIYGLGNIIKDYGNGLYQVKIFDDPFDCREQYLSKDF